MLKKLLLGVLVALLVLPAAAWADPGQLNRQGHVVKVMTRNVYLGADLTPVVGAPTLPKLIGGAGAILRQVSATNFPVRAKGLAAEILSQKPDLVGLQEVAEWRTGPVSFAPLMGSPPTASTVRYDYLQLLLDQLNAGGRHLPRGGCSAASSTSRRQPTRTRAAVSHRSSAPI